LGSLEDIDVIKYLHSLMLTHAAKHAKFRCNGRSRFFKISIVLARMHSFQEYRTFLA